MLLTIGLLLTLAQQGKVEDKMFYFTLNDYVFNEDNGIIIERHNFDNPPVRNIETMETVNKDGLVLTDTKFISVTLTAECYIQGDDKDDLDEKILALKEAAIVDNGTLVFLHNGVEKQYIVTTKELSFVENKRFGIIKGFYIEFQAFDPPYMLDLEYTIAKSEVITNQIYHDPLTLEGTAEQKPVIKLEFEKAATLSVLDFVNKSTGNRLHIENAFVDGDILKIDAEKQKVTLNGEMVDYQSVIPSFISGDNYIDILTLSDSEGMQFYAGNEVWDKQFIVYEDKWLDEFISTSPMIFVPRIDILVSKVGNPTSDLIVDIRDDDGGGLPDSLIATATISKDDIFENTNWINVLFDDYPQVYESYHIVIRTDGGDDENYYQVKYASTDEFADGNLKRSLDAGSNWTNYATYDMAFNIYQIEVDQVSVGSYVVPAGLSETFGTTTYKDTALTTADWNTGESKLKMFQPSIDQQNTQYTSENAFFGQIFYAQSFEVSATDLYEIIDVYVRKNTTLTVGLTVSIRTDDGDEPSDTEIGSGYLSQSSIGTSIAWKTVNLTMSQALTIGTKYWAVFTATGNDNTKLIYLGYSSSTPTDYYANGKMKHSIYAGTDWHDEGGEPAYYDFMFKLWKTASTQYGYSLTYTAAEKFPIVYAAIDEDSAFMAGAVSIYLSNDNGSTWQSFAWNYGSGFNYTPAYFDNISNTSKNLLFKIKLDVYISQYISSILNLYVDYQTAGVLDTTDYRLHNGFKPGFTGDLDRVDLLLKKTGTPGDLTVELYADSGAKPTGSALATQVISAADISTTANWIQVKFDTPYSVTSGTTYHIVIKGASVDSTNMYMWFVADGNPYADGVAGYSSDAGSNWSNQTDYDFNFRTYEGAVDMEINIEAKYKKMYI